MTDGRIAPPPMTAGCTVVSLLADPLCVRILRAHLGGPLRTPDLHERIGDIRQTTLRGRVGKLRDLGALERRVLRGMPYTVENELTDVGSGILDVAELVEAWLVRAPRGPIVLGSESAKDAIRALVGGWDSTILHALTAGPLSLTELDGLIAEVSYPSLERRLLAMRAAGQIEPVEGARGSKPYVVTDWTRQSVGPFVAAGRCEHEHLAHLTRPLTRFDIEASLLLAVPLVSLSGEHGGSCLLAVDANADADIGHPLEGVSIEVEKGRVVSCVALRGQEPGTWAFGAVDAWTDAILTGQIFRLRIGGAGRNLVAAMVQDLCVSLRNTKGT